MDNGINVFVTYIINNFIKEYSFIYIHTSYVTCTMNHLLSDAQESHFDNTSTFLDSLIRKHDATVSIEPFHKNWEYLLQHETRKLDVLKQYDSYSSAKTKLHMLLGALHHLDNCPIDDTIRHQSVIELWTELRIFTQLMKMTQNTLSSMHHINYNAQSMHTLMSNHHLQYILPIQPQLHSHCCLWSFSLCM